MNNNHNQPKIIENKLLNLLRTDSRDACIRTKLSKDYYDLSSFIDKNSLLDFVNDSSKETLVLRQSVNISQLEKRLLVTNSINEVINILKQHNIKLEDHLSTRKRNEWEEEFFEKRSQRVNDIIKSIEAEPRKIKAIARRAKDIYNETGVWPLYIAKNFLIGNTKKPTSVNAPLNLISVEVISNKMEFYIKKREDNLVINEKLPLLLKKDFNNNVISLSFKEKRNEQQTQELVKKIIFKDNIKSITDNNGFINYKQTEIAEKIDDFYLYDAFVLGIYEPTGGAIKIDLENIIEKGVDPFEENFEGMDQSVLSDSYHFKAETNHKQLIQIGRPLNVYQRYAVHSSLVKNTLIYGPPGTGKSEVIANIIANIIISNKNTLIVSEKKAALDVLKDRLNNISKISLFIYDMNDKAGFYSKINDLFNQIGNFRFEKKNPNFDHELIVKKITQNHNYNILSEYKRKLITLETMMNNLYDEADEEGNTFNHYLVWIADLNQEELNRYKKKEFIELVASSMRELNYDYNKLMQNAKMTLDFLNKYSISLSEYYVEKLKNELEILNDLQLKYSLVTSFKVSRNVYLENIRSLEIFLNKNNLYDLNTWRQDYSFLNNLYYELKTFFKNHERYLTNDFQLFLTRNKQRHEEFLKTVLESKTKDQTYIIQEYLNTGSIVNKKGLFQKVKGNEEDLLAKYRIIIDYHNSNFIKDFPLNLVESFSEFELSVFSAANVALLINKEIFYSDYFFDLFELKFDKNLSSNQVYWFGNCELSHQRFLQIYKIYKFEEEILSNYELLRNNDFYTLSKNLRDSSSSFARGMDNFIYENYVEYIKEVLINLENDELKKQAIEISQIVRSKRLPSITSFIFNYYEILRLVFPIWISKPDLVSEILPLKRAIFDYGVFDEASQMFLERSYPVIYRCKTNIVAGDDKQLKPTSFFATRVDEDEEDYEMTDFDNAESLLDRTQTALWSNYKLKNHYRSKRADLISFSNKFIYDNQLFFASRNGNFDRGIKVVNVEGVFNGENEIEAKQIIDILIQEEHKYKKILIVTFNVKQSDLIENMIMNQFTPNDRIYQRFEEDQIVVTNLENVQGNEGDLVILSVTYAKNEQGILRNNYGPLMKNGGSNRLNVAITRATDHMIVVKSIKAEDMSINHNNQNIRIFKEFIHFCDYLDEHKNDLAFEEKEIKFYELTNGEQKIYEVLEANKKQDHIIIHNYQVGNYNVDFVIYNKHTNKIDLIFDVFQNNYKTKNNVALLELFDKFTFLNDLQYKTIIVCEHEVILNFEQIKSNIQKLLEN